MCKKLSASILQILSVLPEDTKIGWADCAKQKKCPGTKYAWND